MTGFTDLERRYRRLLAFYPRAFRKEREEEMVTVLMARSRPEQRWPRPAEVTDLTRHGLRMRVRPPRIPSNFEKRHAGFWALTRSLIGCWLIVLTGLLGQDGRWQWGLLLLPFAALHFFIAYRLAVYMERQRPGGPPGRPPRAMGD